MVAKNYRPVSLLPIVSKVLEKVVQKQLVQYLESLQIIPNEQFAFRKAHSTEAEQGFQEQVTGVVLGYEQAVYAAWALWNWCALHSTQMV